MEKKILTISMLVSGREETTEKSLLSLQPLREQLGAEIILTDTGCTPEYINRIRHLADKILQFTWCRDFAKARNVGLEAAQSQWFMFIDDDEWFEDITPIIDFFQSGEYKDYHQAVYIARNYTNFEGTAYNDEWVSRLIRIEEDTHFEGRVHECLVPVRGKCKQIHAFVHHYGYVFATEEARKAHFNRNVSILNELLEKEPNNMKWPIQLVKEYHSVEDYALLEKISKNALEKIEHVDEPFMNMCRGTFYLAILMAVLEGSDEEILWANYNTFAENEKNPWNVRGALAAFMLLHASENDERMIDCAKAYIEALREYEQQEHTEQEKIIAENIVFVKEYLHTMEQYILAVEEQLQGNAEFLLLSNRVWRLAELGVFPLEELLLDLPFTQWMAQIQVLQMRGYTDLWNELSGHLGSICSRSNIRYTYFDKVLETEKMQQVYQLRANVEKMDYATMTQILTDFAQANLNYMDYLYTESAYGGDMELFSIEEKASLWIAKGLSVDMSQWKMKLQYFSEAAKVCPMLGDFVKRYMQLLGEELTK